MASNEQKVSIMSHFGTEDKVAAGGQSHSPPRETYLGVSRLAVVGECRRGVPPLPFAYPG